MRLKKIEMCGFKSFADRTVVHFDSGITAVVGPNGCGKSNISDAFRWVLGEQSAKSMRGEKMGDVIFSGNSRRKGSPFAEVILTFTEVGEVLPVDYEEVAIGRRLYRNGDSEYRLNGNLVRLRDIQSLFWETGLGKESFAIFEQGKVEEVIVCSPLERRPIFESAAGILRFRIRRKEALQKLEKSGENLARLEDLLGEVNRQLGELEKQVAEAKEYRQTKSQLDQLERATLRAKLLRAEEAASREGSRLERLDERLTLAKERLLAREKGATAAQAALKEAEEQFQTHREELYRVRSEQRVVGVEAEALQKRLAELDQRLAKWRSELDQLQEGLAPLAALEKELAEVKGKEALEGAVQRCRAAQRAAEEQRMERLREEHAAASQLRELQVRLEGASERLGQLEQRKGEVKQRLTEVERLVKEKRQRLEATSTAVDQSKGALLLLDEQLKKQRSRLAQLKSEGDLRQIAIAESRTREKVLLRLKEEREEFSPGAKRLLQAFQQVRPLSEKVSFAQEMAALLEGYSQTLWAPTLDQLQEVRLFAKKEGITGFSITSPELIDMQVDRVDLSDLKRKGCVASDGEYLDSRGVLFTPSGSERSSFAREAELAELKEQLSDLNGEREKGRREFTELQTEIERLEGDRRERDRLHRQEEMRLVEVNFALQRAKADLEQLEKEESGGQLRHQEWLKSKEELLSSIEKLKAQQAKAAEALTKAQALCLKVESELENELQLEQQQGQRRLTLAKLQAMERQRVKGEQEIAQGEANRKELLGQIDRAKSAFAKIESALGVEEERCKRAEEVRVALRTKLEGAGEQLRLAREELQKLQLERGQIEEQLRLSRLALEAIGGEIAERFELAPIQLKQMELPKIESIKESEREVYQLRRKLEAATQVNLGSVEEYEQSKERSDQLTAQVKDLHDSKRELLQMVSQLERSCRKQFRETFEKVRANFQRHFQLLFQGGEADLKLTDSPDILEAGIEIVAQPPGKQMRSMSLLSGGEKCLTALALLFAIFEVNPSPVCILDETDAPLDESNVGRFLAVLDSFLETTQFILITHNKKTMESAAVLIGVTMEERGVSKPIEMRLAEAGV